MGQMITITYTPFRNAWEVMLQDGADRDVLTVGSQRDCITFARQFSKGQVPVYLYSRTGYSCEEITQ